MQSRWFWKNWSKDYRTLWFGCAGLFVLSSLFLWYTYWKGPANVLSWETIQEQKTVETVSHTFEVGNFEFSIPIESYLTFVYFNGSPLQPNTSASYLFIAGLCICAIILLAVITTLSRFWYFTGMGLFILFMVSLRLEVLLLFGKGGQAVPISIMVLFVAVSFYFNSIRSSASFLLRIIVFASMVIAIALLIQFFSGVNYPFLHLSVTGYTAGLILSLLFILMVSHEILASFVYLTGQGTATGKSLRHFSIISIVYLVNLFLAYFSETKIFELNFIYVNLFLLLTTSAILGIWGFRDREVLYGNITPFYPFGAYFFMAMGTITFLTTGFLLGNQNDAALKVIRHLIIFSHIGYGIIFLTYFISNFIVMMAENMPVYKVLYQPVRMPYVTYRIAGSIATLAFVFYMDWKEYAYNSFSGFYNQLGGLYELLDRPAFAEAYYLQGKTYGFQNHHSNYVLGDRAARRNDFQKALDHYDLANDKRPTEFSLVNEANIYLLVERPFDAIRYFRNGLEEKPNSGPIQNNLGFAYSKIHKIDSALYLFEQARKDGDTQLAAEANFLAMVGQEFLPIQADSIAKLFQHSPAIIGNALAIATLHKQKFDVLFNPLDDRELNLFTATQLNNYIVHELKNLDTARIAEIDRVASDSLNESFSEALKSSLAQAYYHQNNITRAFAMLGELGYLSQSMQGEYNYILGLWALEQGAPELAVSNFNNAVMFDYRDARLYNAIALAESGNLREAVIAADTLLLHRDTSIQEIGRQLKKVLTIPSSGISSLNELEKYQYCRYRLTTRDTLAFNRMVNSFQDNDSRAKALLEMSQRQFNLGNTSAAIKYLNQVSGLQLTSAQLYQKIRHFELILLASRGELQTLANQINDNITFSREQELEKLLYSALLSESANDSLTAEKNYKILAVYNPFFVEGVMASARYFKKYPEHDFHAYNILAEAIQVNTHSYRLLMAYAAEAVRMGLDEYAASTLQRAEEIKQRR